MNRIPSYVSFLAAAVFVIVLGAPFVSAQTSRGTIAGTVSDPNGAVVSGANVEIVNKATNVSRTSATNSSGYYRFDAVELGEYDVKVAATGFKTLTTTSVKVSANLTTDIDARLEIGAESASVEVTADAEVLQTTEPVRGGNFSTRQVQNLPLAGLNPYDLGRLLPGVVSPSGSSTFGNDSQFSVNGQRPRANNYLIDGTENNDISVTGPASQINNEDAVQEVSLQTGLFSAEFGRAGGGVFNLVTKAGTNDFHGSLRWLYFSQKFNALTNGQRLAGLTRPAVFNENVFSGTIGGPLPLPRFGDKGGPYFTSGRDKTFFFFGLQYDRFRTSASFGPFRVPTVNGVNQLRALFPAGTNARVDLYLDAIGSARGLTTLQTIALGTGPDGFGNVVPRGSVETGLIGFPASSQTNVRQYVFRIDHRINDRHQIGIRYLDDDTVVPNAAMNSPGFTRDFTGNSRNLLFTHTWVIKSNITNELRVSPYGLINFDFPISPDAPALV